MTNQSEYTPPRIWTWSQENGGTWSEASIVRSPAQRTTRTCRWVAIPLQLYSLGTPNGVKVTVMLEELLALGHKGAECDAWLIKIGDGDQFGSGFVSVNPNSRKIPALLDRSGPKPDPRFESGAILMHLAEKFGAFLPTGIAATRRVRLSWLFWQMGSAPYLGEGLRSFLCLCPDENRICDRPVCYGNEASARRARTNGLADNEYLGGGDYTIADIAVFPWYGGLGKGLELRPPPNSCKCRTISFVQRWAR